MVFDLQPVAYLQAVAVNGQGVAGQRVDDHKRDQLLGKMLRAIVVAAIGGEHWQAIGVVSGTNQVVACRFASALGVFGGKRRLFSAKAGSSLALSLIHI